MVLKASSQNLRGMDAWASNARPFSIVYVLFQQVHFVDKHLDRTLYEQFHLIVENRNTHDIHHPI